MSRSPSPRKSVRGGGKMSIRANPYIKGPIRDCSTPTDGVKVRWLPYCALIVR
jgi:hypothetical protein